MRDTRTPHHCHLTLTAWSEFRTHGGLQGAMFEEVWKVNSCFSPDRSCCYVSTRIHSHLPKLGRDGANVMKVADRTILISTNKAVMFSVCNCSHLFRLAPRARPPRPGLEAITGSLQGTVARENTATAVGAVCSKV